MFEITDNFCLCVSLLVKYKYMNRIRIISMSGKRLNKIMKVVRLFQNLAVKDSNNLIAFISQLSFKFLLSVVSIAFVENPSSVLANGITSC